MSCHDNDKLYHEMTEHGMGDVKKGLAKLSTIAGTIFHFIPVLSTLWLYESGFHLLAITVPSFFHNNNETTYNLRSSEPIRSGIAKHQKKRHLTQSNSIPGIVVDDSNQVKAIKNRGEEIYFDIMYQTAITDIMFCNDSEANRVQLSCTKK